MIIVSIGVFLSMASEDKVKFVVFAEDSDLHGVRQVTRAENGYVSEIFVHAQNGFSNAVLHYTSKLQRANCKNEYIFRYQIKN